MYEARNKGRKHEGKKYLDIFHGPNANTFDTTSYASGCQANPRVRAIVTKAEDEVVKKCELVSGLELYYIYN